MKTLELSKAKDSLEKYARELDKGAVVLRDGKKAVAALISLEDTDWETFCVSNSPVFREIIEESRRSYREEGGISAKELRRQLGLPPQKPRRPKIRSGRSGAR